jgi:phosphatidylglycerophosphatase A
MMRVHKLIATTLGIGYIGKGGGTVAAVFAAICWYLWQPSLPVQWIIIIVSLVLGVIAGNNVEALWGKDDKKVVIDEWAGMCIALFSVAATPVCIISGLILFRLFDIFKPLYIRRLEVLPGGWGVMADDVLAGVYANIVLQLLIFFKLPAA